jgi:hypothetical protein
MPDVHHRPRETSSRRSPLLILLECGDMINISAVPRRTIYRNQRKVIAYYCFYHHDFFARQSERLPEDDPLRLEPEDEGLEPA